VIHAKTSWAHGDQYIGSAGSGHAIVVDVSQEKIANSLKKDKKQIAAEIKKNKQETKRIEAQIQKLIRDAIAAIKQKIAEKTVRGPRN